MKAPHRRQVSFEVEPIIAVEVKEVQSRGVDGVEPPRYGENATHPRWPAGTGQSLVLITCVGRGIGERQHAHVVSSGDEVLREAMNEHIDAAGLATRLR
jgi:hypothetical protein